ncbi:MAG: 50S ribosomal protein L4 [Flavobacteriaceae bacterium]|nr:50S ribosomal protein L4 [Flavobacteriaceae bacterium]
MAEINIVDQANKVVGTRELSASVFDVEADAGFVHRVYSSLASAQRAGTSKVKDCSEVSGGGRKPWKQKGTGRARQGSTRSAQWRHGGVAHGPNANTSFASRINRKERRKALCMVLSDAVREGRLVVLNKLEFAEVKTKAFISVADALSISSGLYVLGKSNREVELSARNIPHTKIILDGQLTIHDLLKFDRIVVTEEALAKIEGGLT